MGLRLFGSYKVFINLKFSNDNEQKATAVEKHWIVGGKNPAELNQPIYLKGVLTSEWKSGNVLHLQRG